MSKSYRASVRALLAALAIATSPGYAKDKNGEWVQGGGVGSVTCPAFNEVMRSARQHPSGSVEFVSQTQGFVMYISGFEAGYNQAASDTYDIFPAFSSDQTLAWTDHYCSEQGLQTFGDAVSALGVEMHPRRQTSK